MSQNTLPPRAAAFLAGAAKVTTYNATGGEVTEKFAAHNLTLLPHPITPGAVIHDNAAGSGTVSRLILAQQPNVKIFATDIDQPFLDALNADAAAQNWPVEVSNQRSESTSFTDATFDLDIANIGIIFWSRTGLDGVREVYRTLKPGGVAVFNCWESITWLMPIKQVHVAFRGSEKPFPAPPISWADGVQLRKVVLEGGFSEEKLRLERHEVEAEVGEEKLREWAEKTWAYLGGIGGWHADDEEKWDEEVDRLVEELKKAQGTTVEGGVVRMKVSQWVAVVEK